MVLEQTCDVGGALAFATSASAAPDSTYDVGAPAAARAPASTCPASLSVSSTASLSRHWLMRSVGDARAATAEKDAEKDDEEEDFVPSSLPFPSRNGAGAAPRGKEGDAFTTFAFRSEEESTTFAIALDANK